MEHFDWSGSIHPLRMQRESNALNLIDTNSDTKKEQKSRLKVKPIENAEEEDVQETKEESQFQSLQVLWRREERDQSVWAQDD